MKKKGKRNGILFWNEEEERLSILYINNNGFLETLQPLNDQIRGNII